jgi:2-polyprenyl-6-hydroxyphenyl methylase/3-demethylubiquinone-9 3-methyltransferase
LEIKARAPLTAQQRLNDFSDAALSDRHERQHSLLAATGVLGEGPFRVLDLGSGSGVTAVWAARKGWRVTAVDIAAEHMAVLRDHVRTVEPALRIEMIVDDVTRCAALPDAAFDIVYLKDLLEHVDDYQACLAAACRTVKPGGLVYVATTNVISPLQQEYQGVGPYSWYPRWLKDRIRRYAMERKPEIVLFTKHPALHWFSRRTLNKALREAGFTRTWDVYDLARSPRDLTRRTRVVYPFIRAARAVPFARRLVDVAIPGLTMVAQR